MRNLGSHKASGKIVLGAGLEPASLSAYAPQTYVSTSSTTRASRGRSKLSAHGDRWQVSSVFFLLMLMLLLVLMLVIVIEITATEAKVFEHEHEQEYEHE